jgi:hypothetical protein
MKSVGIVDLFWKPENIRDFEKWGFKELLIGSSNLVPDFNRGFTGFKPSYSNQKSDASSHQMGKGYGGHVGVGVGDKNGQAGGGLV